MAGPFGQVLPGQMDFNWIAELPQIYRENQDRKYLQETLADLDTSDPESIRQSADALMRRPGTYQQGLKLQDLYSTREQTRREDEFERNQLPQLLGTQQRQPGQTNPAIQRFDLPPLGTQPGGKPQFKSKWWDEGEAGAPEMLPQAVNPASVPNMVPQRGGGAAPGVEPPETALPKAPPPRGPGALRSDLLRSESRTQTALARPNLQEETERPPAYQMIEQRRNEQERLDRPPVPSPSQPEPPPGAGPTFMSDADPEPVRAGQQYAQVAPQAPRAGPLAQQPAPGGPQAQGATPVPALRAPSTTGAPPLPSYGLPPEQGRGPSGPPPASDEEINLQNRANQMRAAAASRGAGKHGAVLNSQATAFENRAKMLAEQRMLQWREDRQEEHRGRQEERKADIGSDKDQKKELIKRTTLDAESARKTESMLDAAEGILKREDYIPGPDAEKNARFQNRVVQWNAMAKLYFGRGLPFMTDEYVQEKFGMPATQINKMMAISATLTQERLGGSLGKNISDADRNFGRDQVPNALQTKETQAALIEFNRALNKRAQEVHEITQHGLRLNKSGAEIEGRIKEHAEQNGILVDRNGKLTPLGQKMQGVPQAPPVQQAAPAQQAPAQAGGSRPAPRVGETVNGRPYLGGNPSDPKSWGPRGQ